MITTQFTLNIGYGHDNQSGPEIVSPVWQEKAVEVYRQTQFYVAAVVTHGLTVYAAGWGCPKGGEKTALITGLLNPQFCFDEKLWRESVKKVAIAVGKHFNQKTLYLSFSDIDFNYLVEGRDY